MLTPEECRRRRNLLKLSTAELSKKAQMSDFTVRRFEEGHTVRQQTAAMIAKALDRAEGAAPPANWIITPELSHAARDLLGWNRERLAAKARLSVQTIIRFENQRSGVRGMTLRAMQAALEAAGVIFVAENGEGPGVRLRKAGSPPTASPPTSEPHMVGPEDEARGGQEALGDGGMKTDD